MGASLIGRATSKKTLREKWALDPASRTKLTPEELIHFQSFMDQNEKFAKRVKKTPVAVFQGFSDRLVKPAGTFALYQSMTTRDKDIFIFGEAEHLIFEEGECTEAVAQILKVWLDSHLPKRLPGS